MDSADSGEKMNIHVDQTGADTAKSPFPGGQADFMADWTHKFIGLEGGWGCIAEDTLIDMPDGKMPIQDLRHGPSSVLSSAGISQASPAFIKDYSDLYKVETEDGRTIVVAAGHRFMTSLGWRACADVSVGYFLASAVDLPEKHSSFDPSVQREDDLHSTRRVPGSRCYCSPDPCRCDARPLAARDIDQDASPSPVDARGHILPSSHMDDRLTLSRRSHSYRRFARLSKIGSCAVGPSSPVGGFPSSPSAAYSIPRLSLSPLRSPHNSFLAPATADKVQDQSSISVLASSSFGHLHLQYIRWVRIVNVERIGTGWIFDIHVPGVNDYWANGLLHHNSGKSFAGASKLISLHLFNGLYADGTPTYVKSAAVAPTYANAKEFVIPALQEAATEAGLDWRLVQSGKELDMALVFVGRSRMFAPIFIRTAEKAQRITGWEVGAVWGDEPARWKSYPHEPSRDPFIQILGRVRAPAAHFLQIMYTYTNEGDETVVYKMFHGDQENAALYRAPTNENPLMAEWAEEVRKNLTPDLAAQYLEGHAISLKGGNVYDEFEFDMHVDQHLMPRTDLPLQITFDFNIRPGMHVEIGQYDDKADEFQVFGEVFAPRLDLRGSIHGVQRWVGANGGWQYPELQIFGDATGRSGNVQTGMSCYAMIDEGMREWPEVKDCYRFRAPEQNPPVIDRVNAVQIALKDFSGKPHWKCRPECARLIDDLMHLKRGVKDVIDKTDEDLSHATDAVGYWVSYLRRFRPVKEKPSRIGV